MFGALYDLCTMMQGNNTDYKHDQYIQCLYASALDGLDIPLWQLTEIVAIATVPGADTQPAATGVAGVASDRNFTGVSAPSREPSISYQDLSNLMLSGESDDSDAADAHTAKVNNASAHKSRQQHSRQRPPAVAAANSDIHTAAEIGNTATVQDPLADLQPTLEGALAPPTRAPHQESHTSVPAEQAVLNRGQAEASAHAQPLHAAASTQELQQPPAVGHHTSASTGAPANNDAVGSTGTAAQADSLAALTGQGTTTTAVSSLAVRAALRQRQHQRGPSQHPSTPPAPPQICSDPARVPLETKVGSLFALYCLFESQPGKVPIYLPLELLLQLPPLLKEAQEKSLHDVGQVMQQLMTKNAFVVGAVRRPVRGSKAAEAAAQPPCR